MTGHFQSLAFLNVGIQKHVFFLIRKSDHLAVTIFTSQYSEEFRVPCSAVLLIYLNEEVLLLHSSFLHQQFFFLSIALVLNVGTQKHALFYFFLIRKSDHL